MNTMSNVLLFRRIKKNTVGEVSIPHYFEAIDHKRWDVLQKLNLKYLVDSTQFRYSHLSTGLVHQMVLRGVSAMRGGATIRQSREVIKKTLSTMSKFF